MTKNLKEWLQETRTVTLTNEQWNLLTTYLLMSTNYRKGEAKAWDNISEKKDKNGNIKFPNAKSNKEFWEEMNTELEIIRSTIDNC